MLFEACGQVVFFGSRLRGGRSAAVGPFASALFLLADAYHRYSPVNAEDYRVIA